MSAYGDMNQGVAGLIQGTLGLTPRTETGCVQEAMTPGMPAFGYTNSGDKVWKLKADVSKLVIDGDLGASNSTVITVNSVAAAAVVYATSHIATMTAILNAIRALAGVEAALDTADTNNRTILIRTKGLTATASGVVTGGTARTITPTNGLFGQVFKGVLALGHLVPSTIGGSAAFAVGDNACVAHDTEIWAQAGAGVESNEKVYVSASTGLFTSTITDQYLGVRCVISRDAASGVALVRVPVGIAALNYAYSF